MKFGIARKYFETLLNDYTNPQYEDPRLSAVINIVPILSSSPGIGKTSLFRQVVTDFVNGPVFKERRSYLATWAGANGDVFGARVLEPAQMDVPDARGYLTLVKHQREDGSSAHLSTYSHPPIIEFPHEAQIGVQFVDELGQTEHDMQKALASYLLEGRTGDYTSRWLRWGATNRTKDASGVKKMLAHFRNRIKIIELEPEADQLVSFCAELGFPPLAYGFIGFRPGIIFNDDVPRDDQPFCTPRSFVSAVMELMLLSGGVDQQLRLDEEAREHVSGWIGKAASAEFFTYMEVAHKVPTIEEIVDNPSKVRVPSEISMRFAVMGLVIHHVDEKNVGKLLTFISRLPQEMQITIVHAFQKRAKQSLFRAPEFAKWVTENQDVIMAVQAMSK